MALRINQNLLALKALGNLNRSSNRFEKSVGKLSSGLRIKSASDDPAGLAISEKLRTRITGLERAFLNAQDGISLIQTAGGGLSNIQDILQRVRELALQSANGTLTSLDRGSIQQESRELLKQINTIANSTEFNTKKLLNGTQAAQVSFSGKSATAIVGSNAKASGTYSVDLKTVQAGISQVQSSNLFTSKSGSIASASTKLSDINELYNANGEFAIGSNEALTLNVGGKTAEIGLTGNDSINDVAAKLERAMTQDLGLEGSRVKIKTDGLGGALSLEVISGVVGEAGEVSIVGSESLTAALGFSTTREAQNSRIAATVTDQAGNSRTVTSDGNRINEVLDGISLQVSSQAAQVAGMGGIEEGLNIKTAETMTVNVGSQTVSLTLGAGKWSMEGIARSLNQQLTDAGISSGIAASVVDGQISLGYTSATAEPIPFEIMGGMTSIGITSGDYSYSAMGNKDKSLVVSGFSAYRDEASSRDMSFVVNGRSYGGFSTVVDPTKADFVSASDMVAGLNERLSAGKAGVRADILSGSLVFTSLQVGTDPNTNARSHVSLDVVDGSGGRDASWLNQLGFEQTTSYGSGETSFRMQVKQGGLNLQVGAGEGQTMGISIGDLSLQGLGLGDLDLSTPEKAAKALSRIDSAMGRVSSEVSRVGIFENRLNYTMSNLENTATNLTAAESRIRDVDMAAEIIEYTRNQILIQAGTAMVAQANSVMGNVLTLLGK